MQTACFALSNLARGEGAQQEALVKAGLIKPLLHHLRVDTVSEPFQNRLCYLSHSQCDTATI